MSNAPDFVTLREAAKRAERSVSTIRRWIKQGILETRQETAKTAPLYVSLESLNIAVMNQEPRPTVHKSHLAHEHIHEQSMSTTAAFEAMQGYVRALTLQVDDLRADKERQQVEIADLKAKLAALETELNRGVRGLLRSWWKAKVEQQE